MKFMPDSAVLGTLGHIKRRAKKSSKKRGLFVKSNSPYFPQRTVGELLELAGHAQSGKKAGKQKKSGKFGKVLLVAKGVTGSRDEMKTQAKFIRRRIAVGLILLALFAWAMDATTPEMCKVPTEQMNQFCLDLIYP